MDIDLKGKIKISSGTIIGFIVMIFIIAILFYVFNYGFMSSNVEYEFYINKYNNTDVECEIVNGVPDNYYSGKIIPKYSVVGTFSFDSLFFTDQLNSSQILNIQKIQIERFSKLPCFDEWIKRETDAKRFPLKEMP